MTTRARKVLDDAMSEAELQRAVIRLAHDLGWRVSHARPAMRADGRWRTPIQGDAGAPDLLLARRGVVLHAELKREGRYPDVRQRARDGAKALSDALDVRDLLAEVERLNALLDRRDAVTVSVTQQIKLADERDAALDEVASLLDGRAEAEAERTAILRERDEAVAERDRQRKRLRRALAALRLIADAPHRDVEERWLCATCTALDALAEEGVE